MKLVYITDRSGAVLLLWFLNITFCYARHVVYGIGRYNHLGPVVQSIVSLTSSLRGQLVKCFMTLLPNTLIFLPEKCEKLLHCTALQKLLAFFSTKILANVRY